MPGPVGTSDPTAIWSSPECPFVIQYSRQVMADIRSVSLSGRFATPRGGMEIGGILLGKRERGRIIVTAQKPLDCEHGFGPLFRLSDNDRLRMANLLSRSGTGGLTVLGWYRSVARGSISLSDADVELYGRYFPERWSVALLVKPSIYSTSAGFFFREQDGSIRADSSYREWQLDDEAPSAELELRVEAPQPEPAAAIAAVVEQAQIPIEAPVPPPRSVLPTRPAPLPVREQLRLMSRKAWNAAALRIRRIPRVSLPLAALQGKSLAKLRNAILIPKPVTAGAILLFAALLSVWWSQRPAKSNAGISQAGSVPDTLPSTSRKSASKAQTSTPLPPPAVRPDTPVVKETVVQTHDAAAAATKPPTQPKKSVAFDPLVY